MAEATFNNLVQRELQASQVLSHNETRAPCSGCEYAVDLRCPLPSGMIHATYHRILNCMMPSVGRLVLLRRLLTMVSSVCLITEAPDTYIKFVPHLLDAAESWKPGDRHVVLGASNGSRAVHAQVFYQVWGDENFPACLLYLPRVPANVRDSRVLRELEGTSMWASQYAVHGAAMRAFVRRTSSQAHSTPPEPTYVVLVQRLGEREWIDLERIQSTLQRATGLPVRIFFGNESSASVVQLFAHARAVIGVHGAAFANLVFTAQRACSLEVTVSLDLDSTSRPFRLSTGAGPLDMRPWNLLVNYSHHVLPLRQVLDANADAPNSKGVPPCDPARNSEEAARRWAVKDVVYRAAFTLCKNTTRSKTPNHACGAEAKVAVNSSFDGVCWPQLLDADGKHLHPRFQTNLNGRKQEPEVQQHLKHIRYIQLSPEDLIAIGDRVRNCVRTLE